MRLLVLAALGLLFAAGCAGPLESEDGKIVGEKKAPSDDFSIQEKPASPQTQIPDVDQIPDEFLAEQCDSFPWPPSCSFVPYEEGRQLCEKCKRLFGGDGGGSGFGFPIAPSAGYPGSSGTQRGIGLSKVREECAREPLLSGSGYNGLLNDVHVHSSMQANHVEFAVRLLEEMNENGVERIVVQTQHLPSGNVESLRDTEKTFGEISAACPRIITLVYAFNPDKSDSWEYVLEMLETGNFGGVGEVEFQHGNLPISHDPESESMLRVYDVLEEKGLPLHFQASLGRDQSLGDKLYKIISSKPKLKFVWFGCSTEKRFLELPNLYCDTFFHSKSRDFSSEWLAKSIIGTDSMPAGYFNPGASYLPFDSVGGGMAEAREKLSALDKSLADKLAWQNFDTVWPVN